MNTVYCHCCKKTVVPVRASFWWKPALFATVIGLVGLVFGVCLLGIGLLMTAPIAALLGIAILPTVVEGATRLPYCSNAACGKYLVSALPPAHSAPVRAAVVARA